MVLTLVVVGGSVVVAARLAADGGRKPATVHPGPHRARRPGRRRDSAAPGGAAVVEMVPPRPGPLVRLRAGLALVVIVATIGGVIALGLLAGIQLISGSLETAVQ